MSIIRLFAFGAAVVMTVLLCCVIVAGCTHAGLVHVATAASAAPTELLSIHFANRTCRRARTKLQPQQLGRGSCPFVGAVPSTPKPVVVTISRSFGGDIRPSS